MAGTASAAKNGKVLILETTVSGGSSSLEAQAAEAAGEGVQLASASQWESLTTAQFAEYDAVVIGDPTCPSGEASIAAANANAATWNAAIGGNVIVIGTDPVYHSGFGITGAMELIKKGVAFAVEKKGQTGAYVDLSCYYASAGAGTAAPMIAHLSEFGGFKVYGQFLFSACPEESHIVASSPALAGLTDEALSHWTCSAHEAFEEWPADFEVLAINKNIGSNYTASDGTVGGPYILSRGATVISNISLTPVAAKNPLGAPHTLTATVTENGSPVAGKTVTFTVIAGPNAGLTGTGETNAEGKATFTYTSKVAGTDVIHATYVDSLGRTETSNTAEKEWEGATTACKSAVGRARYLKIGEVGRLNLLNSVSTTLTEPQRLIVSYESGAVRYRLRKLEEATCQGSIGSRVFHGKGSAFKSNEPGYSLDFYIEEYSGGYRYKATLTKGGEVIYNEGAPLHKIAALQPTPETIL
jgi:hypothetical protein